MRFGGHFSLGESCTRTTGLLIVFARQGRQLVVFSSVGNSGFVHLIPIFVFRLCSNSGMHKALSTEIQVQICFLSAGHKVQRRQYNALHAEHMALSAN